MAEAGRRAWLPGRDRHLGEADTWGLLGTALLRGPASLDHGATLCWAWQQRAAGQERGGRWHPLGTPRGRLLSSPTFVSGLWGPSAGPGFTWSAPLQLPPTAASSGHLWWTVPGSGSATLGLEGQGGEHCAQRPARASTASPQGGGRAATPAPLLATGFSSAVGSWCPALDSSLGTGPSCSGARELCALKSPGLQAWGPRRLRSEGQVLRGGSRKSLGEAASTERDVCAPVVRGVCGLWRYLPVSPHWPWDGHPSLHPGWRAPEENWHRDQVAGPGTHGGMRLDTGPGPLSCTSSRKSPACVGSGQSVWAGVGQGTS